MTAPVNPISSSESVVIDIPVTEGCSNDVPNQVQTSSNVEEVQINEHCVNSDIQQGSQVSGQCNELRNMPYMDRIFGTNFGFPRIYSIFPLMNGFPVPNSNDSSAVPGIQTNNAVFFNATPDPRMRMQSVPGRVEVEPNTNIEEIRPPTVDFNAPPPYDAPPKLPTYEEVQREKVLQGEMPPSGFDGNGQQTQRTLAFLAIDAGDMGPNSNSEAKLLGTECMFFGAFMIALLFNWIGFVLLMCFCHTVAARYGALSGFGLSLAKWTVIVKRATDVPAQNSWLWWLITVFGLLICIRSFFQYVNIKKGWRLMSAASQERVLFFY